MKIFAVVITIATILSYNGRLCLEWGSNKTQNRKLLVTGGAPLKHKDKSIFLVNTERGIMTGIALENNVIALPGIIVDPVVGKKPIDKKSSNTGWSFWIHSDATEVIAEYYTKDEFPPGPCHIYGANRTIPAHVMSRGLDMIDVEATDGEVCPEERGAALVCSTKLVGLVRELKFAAMNDVHVYGDKKVIGDGNETSTTTEVTVPGVDKPEDVETEPPKDRKKREAPANSTEFCSVRCEVTPITALEDSPKKEEIKNIIKKITRLNPKSSGANLKVKYLLFAVLLLAILIH